MADKKGTCWKCGHQLSEVYPAANGTPGFYVCDTPGCSENYAENCAREAAGEAASSLLGKLVYLDGEMPVVVLEFGGDDETRVLHEDTGRTWWVYISRLIRCPADGRQPHAQRT